MFHKPVFDQWRSLAVYLIPCEKLVSNFVLCVVYNCLLYATFNITAWKPYCLAILSDRLSIRLFQAPIVNCTTKLNWHRKTLTVDPKYILFRLKVITFNVGICAFSMELLKYSRNRCIRKQHKFLHVLQLPKQNRL